MTNIAIIGADDPLGGELLRILIHHPEAYLKLLYAPELRGLPVSSVHHGFIGEQIPNFSDKEDLSDIDLIFLVTESEMTERLRNIDTDTLNLKIIDLANGRFKEWKQSDLHYGLSEINRKALVRGAKKALIPSSVASLSLIALNPLASYLLLPDSLEISVAAPKDVADSIDTFKIAFEIKEELRKSQQSFEKGKISLKISPNNSERVMRVKTRFNCLLGIEEILKIYESIYDDHNFSFTSMSEVEGKEVEGTQKCVISVSKPDLESIEIEAVGDCRLRGGAGDAVHVFNLLFNLHEKIGLELKPSRFILNNISTSKPSSWFA